MDVNICSSDNRKWASSSFGCEPRHSRHQVVQLTLAGMPTVVYNAVEIEV